MAPEDLAHALEEFLAGAARAALLGYLAVAHFGRGRGDWAEAVCAENIMWYSGQEAAVPRANKPDF